MQNEDVNPIAIIRRTDQGTVCVSYRSSFIRIRRDGEVSPFVGSHVSEVDKESVSGLVRELQ